MNAALQQRLIGAIVLVAVAVIFLPMLLDGSGARERFDMAMDIPDKPQAPASRSGGTQEPAAGDDRVQDMPEPVAGAERRAAGTQGTEVARAGDAAEAVAPQIPAPADEDTTAATSAGSAGAGEAAGADDGARTGAGAWVVQVGSFQRETNALVLRDQLREQGYEAFVEAGEGDEQTWWRVRVGPVSERAQAEELRVALERERDGSSALVMAYP